MSINQKIRAFIEGSPNLSTLVRLHPDLFAAVEAIAHQDGRTADEVANELIHNALHDRQITESSLQIWGTLTQREREITALIWLGWSNPQIAQNCQISENTVKSHVKNILSKFNVRSKKQVAAHLAGLDLSDWVDNSMPSSSSNRILP